MDDLSLIRSGLSILFDLGLSDPLDRWFGGDVTKASLVIRNELTGNTDPSEDPGKMDLKDQYLELGDKLHSLSNVYNLYSNLSDAIIRVASIHAFENYKETMRINNA